MIACDQAAGIGDAPGGRPATRTNRPPGRNFAARPAPASPTLSTRRSKSARTRTSSGKSPCPAALSSPIVVGDKLVLTAFDDGKLYTIAYNRADGSEAWRAHAPAKEIEPYHKTEGSPAASTPASDGERIVSYFGSCGLFCYDLDGNELWKHEMPPAKTIADFGTGVSPILADGIVVLLHDEMNDPKIIALDAATGKLAVGDRSANRSRASARRPSGTRPTGTQIVAPGYRQDDRLRPGDRATRVWSVDGMPSASCTTPVTADGELVLRRLVAGRSGRHRLQDADVRRAAQANNKADADGDGVFSKARVGEDDVQRLLRQQGCQQGRA